jgi:hypothetical protein
MNLEPKEPDSEPEELLQNKKTAKKHKRFDVDIWNKFLEQQQKTQQIRFWVGTPKTKKIPENSNFFDWNFLGFLGQSFGDFWVGFGTFGSCLGWDFLGFGCPNPIQNPRFFWVQMYTYELKRKLASGQKYTPKNNNLFTSSDEKISANVNRIYVNLC